MANDITKVVPMDSAKKNSDKVESLSGEQTVILGEEKSKCLWNDIEFPDGSIVCDDGVAYKCHMGIWLKQDIDC